MSLGTFTWTDRARPIIEMGVGDTRSGLGQARWNVGRWDQPTARWSGVEPTWLDISCETRSVVLEVGRKRVTDRFVVGAATIVVDNSSGWADPNATHEPGVLTVRPGRQVRVGIQHAELGTFWLYRGFIDGMTPSYVPLDTDTVSFDCIDALGEVNRAWSTPLADPAYAGDTVDERLARVLDLALWPTAKRALDSTLDTLVGTTLGGQVADMLGQAADSNGGHVFGDTSGNVVYRNRGWLNYNPATTPPDGTIGNVEPGSPGYVIPGAPKVDGYLLPELAIVSSPGDTAMLPQGAVTFTAKLRAAAPLTAHATHIAGQYDTPVWSWGTSPLGMTFHLVDFLQSPREYVVMTPTQLDAAVPPGADRWVRVVVDPATSSATGYWSSDGVSWTQANVGTGAPVTLIRQAATSLYVGARSSAGPRFPGLIYWAELRFGDAAGPVVWRFDADDHDGGEGAVFTDPRGRTWTLTDRHGFIAAIPERPDEWVDAVPADVCPVGWERPFLRSDLATRAIVGRDLATAVTADDLDGQNLYGIEPFTRTDLLTESDTLLASLAQRVLRTRAAATAPRIRSVTLDARTSDEALDLMTQASAYAPTRYRCRLKYPRGTVFDAVHMTTGVAHQITPSAWSMLMNLDLAEPFARTGGRWDSARWDRDTWAADAP